MKQFKLEQMLDLLEHNISQSKLEDKEINCEAVNSFLRRHNMRAIKRESYFDYVFYSLNDDFSINFSLNNEALNQPNTEEFLESLYSQEKN